MTSQVKELCWEPGGDWTKGQRVHCQTQLEAGADLLHVWLSAAGELTPSLPEQGG